MIAAIEGQSDAAWILIRDGRIDLEEKDGNGRTALSLTAEGGHSEVVRYG